MPLAVYLGHICPGLTFFFLLHWVTNAQHHAVCFQILCYLNFLFVTRSKNSRIIMTHFQSNTHFSKCSASKFSLKFPDFGIECTRGLGISQSKNRTAK